jgi:hypothetical protein
MDSALLLEAANKAVMNHDVEDAASAPAGFDPKGGIALAVSQKDQREHSVLSRTAYDVDGQLYIQDTVMTSSGDMKDVWRRGKQPLTH